MTVVGFEKIERKRTYWKCICDCKKEIISEGNNLKNGNTQSCGCLRNERIHEANFKDLTGQKFGRLTIINLNRIWRGKGTYWNCLCDCGKKTIVNSSLLIKGNTKSCGCFRNEKVHEANFKDLTGKTFGKLIVVSFNRIEKKTTYWNCKCDCGEETVVRSSNLIKGHTKSCGCYHLECISGEKSSRWLGGISFEPYCPKFNENLKRRVRAFFNNECVICGKSQEENGRLLSCHHVEYNKKACCDGKPVHFAALCTSCHSKTNKDRERWEAMLHRTIDEIYGGRSYYTEDEYEELINRR